MLRTLLHLAAAPIALGRVVTMAQARNLGTVTGVDTAEPLVALTFDDGPHPEYTPRLLDVLRRHGALATFFVIGERVAAAPEIAMRIVEEGHVLANHTWSHPRMPDISGARRREEIRRCAEIIAPLGGTTLFRPPHGAQTVASRLDVRRCGHDCVTWSDHYEDWLALPSEVIASRLRATMRPGTIAVLHDATWDPIEPGAEDRSALIDAVDRVLEDHSGRLRFVTLPELMRHGTVRRKAWIT
jgi:peptidoglycan-N-acetylglucosamine deacetylase